MKRILIDKEATFYKANLHTHTTMSDGKLTPEQVKEEYKKRGYSIVAFTDHEHIIDQSHLNDESFLAITGCEVAIKEFAEQSTLKNHQMRVTHLNFYARDPHNTLTPCYNSVYDHFIKPEHKHLVNFTEEFEREYSPEGVNEIIQTANEAGFLVSYNHPSWSLENATDYLNYDGLFAVEIYNHGCYRGLGFDDERVLDDFWRAGKPILCTAADDAHGVLPDDERCDAFGGWVWIAARSLDYKDVIKALENGDFYASAGPVIKSLMIEDDTVCIEFSDAEVANIITSGRRTAFVRAKAGESINEARFPLKESDGFFRVTVTDKKGKKAYTQFYQI